MGPQTHHRGLRCLGSRGREADGVGVLGSVPPTLLGHMSPHAEPVSDAFILRNRESRETEEAVRLAPAAPRSCDSRGRERDGGAGSGAHRSFERDRDRIMHSKAFRG